MSIMTKYSRYRYLKVPVFINHMAKPPRTNTISATYSLMWENLTKSKTTELKLLTRSIYLAPDVNASSLCPWQCSEVQGNNLCDDRGGGGGKGKGEVLRGYFPEVPHTLPSFSSNFRHLRLNSNIPHVYCILSYCMPMLYKALWRNAITLPELLQPYRTKNVPKKSSGLS